ncbi:3-oxoacyl-ACP reductase family protein [Nocardia sp. NPDC050378]|uniref:3-oxoacyl-ACP reductase family protein n=1 Tax=Nocardia sp. NPDC050378 TaxID=3155400 RepID=UPI0033E0D553
MAQDLTELHAFVTGGSRGIGEAIVRRLAADGARVTFTYNASEPAATALVTSVAEAGGVATAVKVDSADQDALRAAIRDSAAANGRLDILVNNAGVGVFAPIETLTAEDYDRVVGINLGAVFHASQEALGLMKSGGRIINIGSVNAERNPLPGASIYALSKAGVAGFTGALAREVSARGITVNTVQPGPVATELNPAVGPFADLLNPHIAAGRYGEVEEVAALVAYLSGPEAAYITGASINIDGGFTA